MVHQKNAREATASGSVVTAPTIRTGALIVTRADRGVFDECCIRVGVDPRDRRVRYVTVDDTGIRVHVSKQGDIMALWHGARSA